MFFSELSWFWQLFARFSPFCVDFVNTLSRFSKKWVEFSNTLPKFSPKCVISPTDCLFMLRSDRCSHIELLNFCKKVRRSRNFTKCWRFIEAYPPLSHVLFLTRKPTDQKFGKYFTEIAKSQRIIVHTTRILTIFGWIFPQISVNPHVFDRFSTEFVKSPVFFPGLRYLWQDFDILFAAFTKSFIVFLPLVKCFFLLVD